MAKTIEEINDAITEWQKENPKERSFLLIAGYEEKTILTTIAGPKHEIVGNIASKLIQEKDVTEIISQAIRITLEYANEKTEDN